MKPRVRYAPSPTGLQHIGGVRTALFNYFFAKATGGVFFLRIEDTDQGRFDERAVADIYETFAWLGIRPDEGPREGGPYGPYVQSERLSLYAEHASRLIDSGHAYRCFCTAEELEKMRSEQQARAEPTGYDRRCSHLDPRESEKRAEAGERHVIRFRVPQTGETVVEDVLLGKVSWPNKDINPDPVILKADGFPTYHLAHIVDDTSMHTTHVLRGQEWLPSAPLHVLMFEASGWKSPLYCHLSMIMGQDGHKLSKRHGSTGAQEFRIGGYLAAAVVNYVTLLGWSYDGEREIFSLEDLEQLFTLEKLSKSPATFDYQKLDWFNAYWLRQLSDDSLADKIIPYLVEARLVGRLAGMGHVQEDKDTIGAYFIDTSERELILKAIPIARERLHKLSDAPGVLGFLFRAPDLSDPAVFIPKKQTAMEVADVLARLLPHIASIAGRADEENEAYFHNLAETWGMKVGQVLMPLRLAVTGTPASPPLMASIRLLGTAKASERIAAVIEILRQ